MKYNFEVQNDSLHHPDHEIDPSLEVVNPMKELEDFVSAKKKKKGNHLEEDIYELCDQFLSDLSYLDQELNQRESHSFS